MADTALDLDNEAPCEWCGKDLSLEATDCVIIHCNACEPRRYHESCLEKVVSNIKYAKVSKTASKGVMGLRDRHAPCPRGKGPGTLSHACPGRVEKVIFARLLAKKAPVPLPPVEEVRPQGKQKKQKAPHVPPPTAPKPQKPKAPPVNYQRPTVVHRAPAFPAYVSSSVQALTQSAAPAAPPPGAEFVEDEAAAAKANKAALKNLKRRAKQRQQQQGTEGPGDGQGANGSSMGPQASEEWESFSGMGGTGGAGSVDGFSITDASGEFVGGIEFEDDVLLAMRLQQEENEAAAAAARARQQQPQRPPADTWPLSSAQSTPQQLAQPAPPPQPQSAAAAAAGGPSAGAKGGMGAVSAVAIPDGPTWRCGPHPPRTAQECAFVGGPGSPDWPRSSQEWVWFLYGVTPAGGA